MHGVYHAEKPDPIDKCAIHEGFRSRVYKRLTPLAVFVLVFWSQYAGASIHVASQANRYTR